ncbi:MAG: hypothetical protein KAJ03_05065 [Gammaproteobacteria bacterium]|nr:hypothetical protein [Gammaproteobacteria bacterium]
MNIVYNLKEFAFALFVVFAIHSLIGIGFYVNDLGEYDEEYKGVKDSINYSLPFGELQDEIHELCNETQNPSWCREGIKNSREYRATFGIP